MSNYTYLALGDSYTIGEQVLLTESFPYQAVQLLRRKETGEAAANAVGVLSVTAPEIIAKTGWTTDELLAAIKNHIFLYAYDFVTLLIGVNNQYRGRTVEEFIIEFEHLLQLAIQFAGGNSNRVFVLSIPDWGMTPFASGKDHVKISGEIDAYNNACKSMTEKYHAVFIDITTSQRTDAANADFLTADQLHPSGNEYAKWATSLSKAFTLSV